MKSIPQYLSVFSGFFPVVFALCIPELMAADVRSFATVYEPSGVVQVRTGEVVVVEDEGDTPLYLSLPQENSQENFLGTGKSLSVGTSVDDLEGLTVFSGSTLYAITSHSPNKKGKRKKKREKLLKLTISNGRIAPAGEYGSLQPHIVNRLQLIPGIEKGFEKTINIEGLSFDESGTKLLVGLRSPTIDGKAVILEILNPAALFEHNQPPVFSDRAIQLDIGGSGIRAMEYFPSLQRYLLAGEVRNKKGKLRSRVWAWDGIVDHSPTRVKLPKLKGTKNIEGIAPVRVANKRFLLIVCDDGKREKKQGAHYVLLEEDRI